MQPKHGEWHNAHGSDPASQNVRHQPVYWPALIRKVKSQKVDIEILQLRGNIGFPKRNLGVQVVGRL
ncbi:hypothetical protein D3C73_953140 [compost metagenome]